jgi:hypothetical protein
MWSENDRIVQKLRWIREAAAKAMPDALAKPNSRAAVMPILAELLALREHTQLPKMFADQHFKCNESTTWWHAHGHEMPILSVIAEVANVTAVSTVEVERTFSILRESLDLH